MDWHTRGGLLIQELDGSPSGRPVTLKVSNGTLTDNGDGSFTLTTGGGGGGTPGGSNTQVQFNDSGSFGGDTFFTWNKTTNILYLGIEGDTGKLFGPDAVSTDVVGGALTSQTGAGNGTGSGGTYSVYGGVGGASGNGGRLQFVGGDGGASGGNGANVDFQGGSSPAANGGSLSFAAGNGLTGSGGSIAFNLGNGVTKGTFSIANYAGTPGLLDFDGLTGTQTYTFPDATGTLALVGSGTGLVASQVAYGDASNLITSDSNFTRDFTTFETAIIYPASGGDLGIKAGATLGSDMISLKQDDANNPVILALGNTGGLGGSSDSLFILMQDIALTKTSDMYMDSGDWELSITDGATTSGNQTTVNYSSMNHFTGTVVYRFQTDALGFTFADSSAGGNGVFDFSGLTVSNKTYTWPDASGTVALLSDIPSGFITAVSDTNTIDLTVGGTTLSADLRYVDSASINFSDSGSGLTGIVIPAGSDTHVQFNDGGILGGDADFTWNKTTNVMTVTGTENITGQFNTDNLRLDGNTISSTDTNGNIVLDPNGTGFVSAAKTVTNNASEYEILQPKVTQVATSNGTYNATTINPYIIPVVNSGITNSGFAAANVSNALRNSSSIFTNDSGTLDSLYGIVFQFGHYNTNVAETPLTTNVTGMRLAPYARTGTITTLKDLHLDSINGAGTVTTHFGVYQEATTLTANFFGSKVGIGTTDALLPQSLLDVSATTGGIITLSRRDTSATAGDSIGLLQFWNNDTQLTTQNIYANIEVVADRTITTDAAAGKMVFRATPNVVAASPTDQMYLTAVDAQVVNAGTSSTSILTTQATQTVTNKTNVKRSTTTNAPGATPTVNATTNDIIEFTGLNTAITSMTTNLTSGSPTVGQTLWIALTDDGTARAITWSTGYESSVLVTLPTTTVLGKRMDVGFVWNPITTKWRCIANA